MSIKACIFLTIYEHEHKIPKSTHDSTSPTNNLSTGAELAGTDSISKATLLNRLSYSLHVMQYDQLISLRFWLVSFR